MSRISPPAPTSSPATPAPPAEISVPRPKPAFRDSRWRPALCCVGALGIGMSLAPLLLQPARSTSSASGTAPLPEIALATSNTLVVTPATPPGALLRGRIRLVAGETDALGRARVSGMVARQLVENGARVERGDAVLEITSGARIRSVPASEFRQNRAERSQIAASNAQTALAQKVAVAQTRLRGAQERVTRAQAQVSTARDIVRRLQNGQSVAPGEIPAAFREVGALQSRRNRRNREDGPREDGPTRIAARQAQAARGAAQESARALETARTMLTDVQNAARQAEDQAQNAAKAVVDVEARFDEKKSTGADVEAARSAQKEAQSAFDAANKALVSAKAEVAKREKSAASAQSYAQSSASAAAQSLAGARLEGSDGQREAPEETPPETNSPALVTLDSAIRFAGAALEESRRASRDAERLHAQIDGFQSQASTSNSRIEAATQALAQAQQQVMDSVPRPRYTTTYAPSGGIVTWVSRLAREVGAGEAVFGIAQTQRAAARFEDSSGLWRAVKPGAILTGFVVDAPTSTGNAATPPVQLESAANLGIGHEVQLKMTQIDAPQSGDKSAKLTGVPVSKNGETNLPEGAQVLVSMPRPGQKATLSVPTSALIQRGTVTYVALLAPLSTEEKQARNLANATVKTPTQSPVQPDSDATPSPIAVENPQQIGEVFRLRWTPIETGRSDGLRLEIKSGLQAGARVVSQPEELEAMGFLPAATASATVLNTGGTAEGPAQASNPQSAQSVPPIEVLVRLTPALA